jgi:PPOX class probable F420-dependent enzyme
VELDRALRFAQEHHQGVVATIKRDGRPSLANIAFAAVDGLIRISTRAPSAKASNLRRDPRASLHVVGDNFYSYVVIESQGEVTPVAADPGDAVVDELVEVYRSISGEHPDWDEFRHAMVDQERVVLRLRPERAYGMLAG